MRLESKASIPQLIQVMSVEDKIDLLVGKSFFSTRELPQYGIPSIMYLDGATGVNLLQYVGELIGITEQKTEESEDSNNESGAAFMKIIPFVTSHCELPEEMPEIMKQQILGIRALVDSVRPDGAEPGCFPPGMLLGATWEPDVIYHIGEAVAREAMAFGVDVLLGTPNTNIHRDPKNGRLFESFSEDPYLSSRMAPAFVKGVQDQGMPADVKHFAANNQETLRQGINEHISERALREIYLPGFEAAVKEGKVKTVMSAYNSINGKPCAQNSWLLTDVLKKEWGFEGQVVSDWGAVYEQVEAMNAGNDMDMPGPRSRKALYEAVKDGRISMERIDDAVRRTLELIVETPKFQGKKYTTIDEELSRNAAYTAAAEGITLLKNDGILPLSKENNLAFYGKYSRRYMDSGAGSAQVDTSKTTSLIEEAKKKIGADKVSVDEIRDNTDIVIITAGSSGQEGSDRPEMDFDPEERTMLISNVQAAKEAGKKIILVLNVEGPVDLTPYLDDVSAVLCVFFPGMKGGRATADILYGDLNPSGKLPLTFPKHYRDCPTYKNFPGEFGEVTYGEGIYVGYRYYDAKGVEPLYPFGYGLSYTEFDISDIQVSTDQYDNRSEDPLKVTVKVRNIGKMAGKEVVQLYVRQENATLDKPEKELKAFAKTSLAPGEEKEVELCLNPHSFASYDTSRQEWTMETGVYQLLVGDSSRNILQKKQICLIGKNPYGLSAESSIAKICESEKAMEACERVLGEDFDPEKLKSQAIYFGSTPLKNYMRGVLSQNETYWEKLISLNEELERLEGGN